MRATAALFSNPRLSCCFGHQPPYKTTLWIILPLNSSQMATKIPKAAPAADGILKPKKDNIPVARKNVAAKVNKVAPSTRGVQQAELRDQNQLLVAANEDLHKNLSETQQRVDELEQQFSELQKENTNMTKSLNDCHVALIAGKIDPVTGETVGKIAQKEDQRREVQNVSRDLLNELKTFGDVASTQVVQLEAINTTIKDLTEARLGLMPERELFSQEAAEMERALEEAEGLLA